MTITHALLIIGIGLVAGTLNTVVGSAAPVSAPARKGAVQPTPRARTDPRPFPR